MRRALRITAWTLGSLLLLVVLLIVAVLVTANTESGRALIERQTASLTHGHVRLEGLGGSFPSDLTLARLQLSDDKGVWLTAERARLRWSPLSLLAWHINIDLVAIDRLAIDRRPVTEPSPKQSSSSPNLPRTDLRQLQINTLALGPELAGMQAALTVQANAHLISMRDAKASLTARRTDGNGDYELALSFDPARIDATLKLQEPAGGTLENLLQYPGLGALSVNASLHGPRTAEQLQLAARAGELNAQAQGTADLSRESAELTYDIDAPAMSPRPGLSWEKVSLHGQWHGTLKTPKADGRLRIEALRIPGGTELAALAADLTANGGSLAVRATADGLVIPGSQPKLLTDSPVHLNATIQLNDADRPVQLAADHPLFSLQAHATTARKTTATFSVHLPDLTPLAALGGQKNLRGQADLKGKVQQTSATTRLELNADTTLQEDTANLVTRLLPGTSKLQMAAVMTQSAVDVERLDLNGRMLSIAASGDAQRGTSNTAQALQSVRARYTVKLSDLSVLSPVVAGTATLDGQVDGPLQSMATQLQARSELSVRGSPRETLQANLKARGLPALTNATLQAKGTLEGAPLHLDAAVDRTADKNFHIVVNRSEWKSARIQGDLTTAANLTSGHGGLQLRMERLADLAPLIGTQLDGSIDASATLRPVGRQTYAQLRLEARNVAAAGVSANALLTAAGPMDALAVQVGAQSPDLGGEPASLETQARLNVSGKELSVQRLEARYHGQTARLLSATRVSFGEGLAVSQLKLGVQKALLMVDGRISPQLDLRASVHHIDSDVVEAFVPGVLAEGTVDADARVQGTTSAPTGTLTVKAQNLRLATGIARDLPAVNVQATSHLMGDTAQLDTRVSIGTGSRLSANGTVPLNANGNLNLKLTGKLDAAAVSPMLEARGERAGGTLAVNATVGGTAKAPRVQGTADLTQGDFRDYTQGLHLTDITAHLVANEGVVQIAKLTARAAPGQITVTGTIGVLQPQMPIDIHLAASNAQPITSDLITANIDAGLDVKGSLSQRLDVTGTINPKRAVIGIPGGLPPNVAVLDVRRPGEAPPPPPERQLVIGLDINIHAPREILVQGRGLDAELGGNLRITGTSKDPQINGGFEMIRGTFKLVSTTLTFKTGRVSFNGAGLKGKIDPTLDFVAEAQTTDADVTLHITGLADSPEFDLSSNPSLPQDEILARLLFGVPASQLTTLQIAQIGAALASLSGAGGGGGGLNPVAMVQKALGLDRLSVGGAGGSSSNGGQGPTGASVEAGRYVSNRVYVGARQSTTGFSQVEVDVDLSKHLKLQTRLGNGSANTQGVTPENDPGSSVGLEYQIEY